ncbi:DUF4113 domain-containing protein [Candidatus Kaiserbacteria bacterium]|nr:DUF4113 domain-containing protein [Candidatus Kaiserbacteria bacterium]
MFVLLDCNNFFVSCERLFRPDLVGRPTIVAGGGGGVVVARSEEAKELGIPMAAPYFQVEDIVKKHNVAVFSANFELYKDISARVMRTLEEEVGHVYQYSIDEAFMVLKDAKELPRIKALIEKHIGIPVSLGAGKTMTIAKYASEYEKRGSGLCVLEGEKWQKLTPDIPLAAIWGIGGKTARAMREHELVMVQDLLDADPARIETLFGIHGTRVQKELGEHPVYHPKDRLGMQKSIMSTRSLTKTTIDLSVLESALAHHVEQVAKELREMDAVCSVLNVSLGTSRFGDWALRGGRKEVVLIAPTSDTRLMLKEALHILRELYEPDVLYKKVGVSVSRIVPIEYTQHTLFAEEETDNTLMSTLDSINERFGVDTLTIGRVAKQKEQKNRSPRYTTRWAEVKRV